MPLADWLQIVSVPLVVVALVLNGLQAREVGRQSKALGLSLDQGAYQSLVKSHTDFRFTFFYDDPEMLAWHLTTRGYPCTSEAENKRRLYVLIKIEVHEENYVKHLRGLLDSDVWDAWLNVIRADFAIPVFLEMWPPSRRYFAPAFAAFIDGEVLAPG
ncbi:hypothetical protein [Planotetraspora kaengkrachanensis]|uniref:Uncharacterized protein n=1 Tax=Planotetraspora kaengkrachanensis TaxID=575193 RepID=A0A8J3PXT7_9ACTN|nr:hypothetical protein [Planotetraspora kaengkrachanensis]GIG83117.1 hypothetical protein Pka01_62440 [Planotetraspora kaengkrachanensis]